MSLTKQQIFEIEDTLKTALRHKFSNYNPEPVTMPFHTRLLGKDRLALFSFIHSLNTNFGTSIFEPVAVTLAKTNFKEAHSQVSAGSQISEQALFEIQKIMDNLTAAHIAPSKANEIEILRRVCQKCEMRTVKPTKIDIALTAHDGSLHFFDIKTAKPNKGGFKEFKRTLLEWAACVLANNPQAAVNTYIAIPYNPYAPKPYSRWTMAGMLDLNAELKWRKNFGIFWEVKVLSINC
ncbi:MAG: TdeIII family type II restriction endonuclease [Massilibacteroides sp.]|nr:TdeIII family type II restriction endonuclease [Massilibacteroides sp.]MDD4516263.1 TdeIII family type II restriction endonuclease [Massilibacteroides sp.]